MEFLFKCCFHHLVLVRRPSKFPCYLQNQNFKLYAPLAALFHSARPSTLLEEGGRRVVCVTCHIHPWFCLTFWASWVAFLSVLDLSKCCWASSSPMSLSQHFRSRWSSASICVHGQPCMAQHHVKWGGRVVTPQEYSKPLNRRDGLWAAFSFGAAKSPGILRGGEEQEFLFFLFLLLS